MTAAPQRACPQRVERAGRVRDLVRHGAASPIHADSSPAERRVLCQMDDAASAALRVAVRPEKLTLHGYTRWGADVIAPRPISPLVGKEKRRTV